MSEVTDTFIIMGIQDIKQIANWNPIFIDIISSLIPFLDFVLKYPPSRFIYRFRLTSITISTSMINSDNTILITCVGSNNCVNADVNREEKNVLGIIHTENLNNWEQLKNISNISFSFFTESIHNSYIKNSNSRNKNIIKFKKEEVKIPHFNFAIDAIYS